MVLISDRTVSYVFKGSFTNLNAGLATAGKNVAELGTKLAAADRNGAKMRAGLTTLGTAAGKVGLAAGVGLAVVVGVTANFEKAMSRVGAATRATGDDLEDLRAAAIKAGADTIFSASEAADGITELGKAGLSTADILGGGLTGALDLAAAGQIDVAEAASTTAITLQQFGLAGTEATHVADVLAASAGKAMGDVSDMSAALKYVGPVAAQMGISLDQAAGTIAELASQGVIGEQAGTSLRGMLTALTSPSKQAADQMQALGINMYDANGQFVGLDGVAGELADSMSGLSSAERDQALGRIFGNEQITAARILYAGGADDVQKWTNAVDDTGYAADQASKLTDNLSGDLEQLKGSLETALIGAGSGSQGPFRKLIQGLTATTNAFVGLPPAAQNTATALLGITAVTGGALWFGSKVVNGIVSTKEALSQLGITSNTTSGSLSRVARTASGIVAVAGAVTILGNELAKATGAKVDSSNLARDLEALAGGRNHDLLARITEDYRELGQTSFKATEPIKEAVTAFGLFGNTALDNSADNIAQVDDALASMVESGNADQAAKTFAQIASSITGLPAGSSFSPELLDGFDSYATALDNSAHAATEAGTAADGAKGPTDAYGVAARQAANATADEAAALNLATEAMQKKTAATLAGFDAETGYRQALKDAQAQAGKNNAGIRGNTDAALANRSALSSLAAAWDNQSTSVKNNVGRYREARASFIQTATAMGVPTAAAKKLADQLLEIPKKTVAKVEANTTQAEAAISGVRLSLSQLHDKTVLVSVKQHNIAAAQAEGGTVAGQRYPYADKVLTMLAPGEEVISNRYGQADRFRADRSAGRIPGYANGGTIGQVGSATFASANPFYGLGHAAHDAGISLDGFSKIGLKELKQRDHILDRQQKQAEKEVQASEDRLAEMRDQLKAMKDARQQFADSVKSNFMTSLFGNNDLASQITNGALVNSDLGNNIYAYAQTQMKPGDKTAYNIADYVQGYLDTLTQDQLAKLQVQANTGQLRQDTSNANTFADLLKKLRREGLKGGAYRELAASGDLSQAQAYAGLPPRLIRQLVEDYKNRQTAVNRLGKQVGDAEFGRQINRQTRAVERQTELVRENRDHLKEIERLDKLIEQRLQKIEKHTRDNAKDTGDAVTKGLNGASSAAQRSPK